MRGAKPHIHNQMYCTVERTPRIRDCGCDESGGAMNLLNVQLQEKIRDFRDRAQQSKLKAAFSDEHVVRKIYEDAARQWESLADNLEKSGRPF